MMLPGFRSRWIDAEGVRRGQRVGDLDAGGYGIVDRQRPALQAGRQRLAVDQLHDEVPRIDAADHRRPDVVQRADVRVGQLRDEAGLPLEAIAAARVGGERGSQHLDRDGPVEARVERAVDLAHPASADEGGDLEVSQPAARCEARCLERALLDAVRWCAEESIGLQVHRQERFHFLPQRIVVRASPANERETIGGRRLQGAVKELPDAFPVGFRAHLELPRSSL